MMPDQVRVLLVARAPPRDVVIVLFHPKYPDFLIFGQAVAAGWLYTRS